MSTSKTDELVRDYLERLESELAQVPADRREEIVSEMRSHIAEERARGAVNTEADLHNMLERLGDPREIALAARPAGAAPERRQTAAGLVESLALVLTPIIWPVGVILYWLSPRWNTRDKLIATLLPPGGYPSLVFGLPLILLAGAHSVSCATQTDAQGNVIWTTCPAPLPGWEQVLAQIGLYAGSLLMIALPVVVAIYMARRLRSSAPLEAPPRNTPPSAPARGQAGLIEILAMVLTPIIWPVGVILYWTSSHWRTRDKVIATVIPPGGYPGLVLASPILLFSMGTSGGCGYTTDAQGNITSQQCFGFDALPGWEQFAIQAAGVAAFVLLASLPVLVGIYMAWRLRREIATEAA